MTDFERAECEIDVNIFATESGQVHRKRLNCSSRSTTLSGLVPGRYRVCASVDEDENEVKLNKRKKSKYDGKARCVEVQAFRQSSDMIVLLLLAGVFGVLIVVVLLVCRSLMKRSKKDALPPQCFMPAQEVEITHKAHYIKLLATTKV